MHKSLNKLIFNQIRLLTAELSAIEHLKNQCIRVVKTLVIGSSFLQVTKATIKSRMSSKLGQIQPLTAELTAIDQLKKNHVIWTLFGRLHA